MTDNIKRLHDKYIPDKDFHPDNVKETYNEKLDTTIVTYNHGNVVIEYVKSKVFDFKTSKVMSFVKEFVKNGDDVMCNIETRK